MKCRKLSPVAFRFATVLLVSLDLSAQNDPGPRPGPAAAGSFFPTLNSSEQALFNQASQVLQEIDSVSGTIAGEPGSGLGPTFNGNSCTQCHAQPAPGGSSPGQNSPQNSVTNPQIALATLHGAINTVPSFVTANGPMLEARFDPNGTPDGRRARPLHHPRPVRCFGLHSGAARLRHGGSARQPDLPHSHPPVGTRLG
jgi:hypothetical protein